MKQPDIDPLSRAQVDAPVSMDNDGIRIIEPHLDPEAREFVKDLLKRALMLGVNGKYPSEFCLGGNQYYSSDLGGQFTISVRPLGIEMKLDNHPMHHILSRIYPLSGRRRKELADIIFATKVSRIPTGKIESIFKRQIGIRRTKVNDGLSLPKLKREGDYDLYTFSQLQCPNRFLEEVSSVPSRAFMYTPFHVFVLLPSKINLWEPTQKRPDWIPALFAEVLEDQLTPIKLARDGKHGAVNRGIALLPPKKIVVLDEKTPVRFGDHGVGYASGGRVINVK